VTSDDEIGRAWDAAFAHRGVTLIDAYVSKNVPPLPPDITAEYAKNMAHALLKGDPDEFAVIRDSAKALASEGLERVKGALHVGHRHDEHS
jgi:pyruvate dehydrogenase (quinone)